MEKELSFDAMLDQVATQGEDERQTIELAKEISAFIEVLVKTRISRGLTQRQLAEKCGIKQSAIARIERIQVIPRLDTILKIAKCLETTVTVDSFVKETTIDDSKITVLQDYKQSKENYCWNQQYCIYK